MGGIIDINGGTGGKKGFARGGGGEVRGVAGPPLAPAAAVVGAVNCVRKTVYFIFTHTHT